MRSNRICAREEPAAGPSSFRNIVRISMDLSVISVVLVSSRRTRGLVSINLIRNGVLQLLVVIFIMWRTHREPWIKNQRDSLPHRRLSMPSLVSWTSSTTKIKSALSSSNIEYFHSRSYICWGPSMYNWNSGMSVRQHTYEEKPVMTLITESESISELAHRRLGFFGLISTNELYAIKSSQGRHD